MSENLIRIVQGVLLLSVCWALVVFALAILGRKEPR